MADRVDFFEAALHGVLDHFVERDGAVVGAEDQVAVLADVDLPNPAAHGGHGENVGATAGQHLGFVAGPGDDEELGVVQPANAEGVELQLGVMGLLL